MKKVLVSGYYGFQNAGDEAILEALTSQFANNNMDTTVLSASPELTSRTYGVKAVNRFDFLKIIKELKKADLFVSGGGSLFQDVTSSKSLYYYLGLVLLARIMRKKVYVFSQGIGPIKKKINRRIFSRIINGVDAISVRDGDSLKEIKELGITKPKISLTADSVFLLKPADKESAEKILKSEGISREGSGFFIGIAPRRWGKNNDSAETFAGVLDELIQETNAKIVLFPFHYEGDLELSKEIAEKMKNKAYIIEGIYRPSEIMAVLGLMDINIGVRLHSLIFSICMGVPVAGISYDPKIDGFLKDVGIKPICRYEELNKKDIKEEIERIIANKEELKKTIHLAKERLKGLITDNIKNLMEMA